MENDRALTIRLPEGLYVELKAWAEEEDRTVASIFRTLAREQVCARRNRSQRGEQRAVNAQEPNCSA